MKKASLAIFFIAISFAGWSQYKKAGFFSSKGRTISIGSTAFIMGDGKGAPIGFFYEGGRESPGKRVFTYGTISVIPAYKFAYQTTGTNYDQTEKINLTVTGSTTWQFLYAFNVGYFLLSQDNEEIKLKPFVTLGANVLLAGHAKEVSYSPDGYDADKDVRNSSFTGGFRGGVGAIYALSPKFSLKLDAGYSYQFNLKATESSSYDKSTKGYYVFASHPTVSIGIRYSIFSEE